MLKLKLQNFGHLMQITDSLKKTLMLGKIEGRRRGGQRIRWLDGITNSMDMSFVKLGVDGGQGGLACCNSWGRKESDTTVQKYQFFGTQFSLWSNSHIHTWPLEKPIALTRRTFVSKVMSLIFNMLSRSVIAFLPRSKCLLKSWLQSPSAVILEPKKTKSTTVFIVFPSICHEKDLHVQKRSS